MASEPRSCDSNGLLIPSVSMARYPEGLTPVPLEVPAGSVVFFGPLLVHKSEPNLSAKDRRALLYSYQPAGFTHSRDIAAGSARSDALPAQPRARAARRRPERRDL